MRILVVDDFSASRSYVISILKDSGFENSFGVSNGYAALSNLKSKFFDCVVIKWEMEEMTGLELLKKIRSEKFLKNIPVLIIMDQDLIDNVVSASRAGENGFLSMPFTNKNFTEKLSEIFEKI